MWGLDAKLKPGAHGVTYNLKFLAVCKLVYREPPSMLEPAENRSLQVRLLLQTA